VDPRLGGSLRFPPAPRPVGADERLLGALLGSPCVAQDPGEGEEDSPVAIPEQLVEVLRDSRSVGRSLPASALGIGSRACEGKAGSWVARSTLGLGKRHEA
jgi:hypothetical protein